MKQARGPRPAEDKRSVEVSAAFEILAGQDEPVPLSAVMHGGDDAYVIFMGPYSSFLFNKCSAFSETFIHELLPEVPMTSDYNCKLVVFDATGLLDEAIFSQSFKWLDTSDSWYHCVKLDEVFILEANVLATSAYLKNQNNLDQEINDTEHGLVKESAGFDE